MKLLLASFLLFVVWDERIRKRPEWIQSARATQLVMFKIMTHLNALIGVFYRWLI